MDITNTLAELSLAFNRVKNIKISFSYFFECAYYNGMYLTAINLASSKT